MLKEYYCFYIFFYNRRRARYVVDFRSLDVLAHLYGLDDIIHKWHLTIFYA